MERQKAKDLRDQTEEELEANFIDARKALFDLRNKKRQERKLDKPHEVYLLRKNIARYKTVLREKKLAKESEADGTNN